MYRFPSREDVDRASVSDEQYLTLFNSGVECLNPPSNWSSTQPDPFATPYVFRIHGLANIPKLVIASDVLYRAYEKNPSRRGLILANTDEATNVKELQSMMPNPQIADCYRVKEDWRMLPANRNKPLIQKEKRFVVRKLGNSPNTRITWTRIRRFAAETSPQQAFQIQYVFQSETDFLFRADMSTISLKPGKLVEVKGVHPQVDGKLLVKKTTKAEFTTSRPFTGSPVQGNAGCCAYSDLKEAVGTIVGSTDEKCILYHLVVLPGRPLRSEKDNSWGRSSQDDSIPSFNPFLGMQDVESPSSFVDPLNDPPFCTATPEGEISRKDLVLHCVRSSVAKQRVINYCFNLDRIEATLYALLHQFGVQSVSVVFDQVLRHSKTPKSLYMTPIEGILPKIQQMTSLIETPAQNTVLKKLGNGENWLFLISPTHVKIATYIHIIKCLFDAKPYSKVLILLRSYVCAEQLKTMINQIMPRFGLDPNLFNSAWLPGRGQQHPGYIAQVIRSRHVVITTSWYLDQALSSNICALQQFSAIIWDHCENMMGYNIGHSIIQHYRELPLQQRRNIKIYAFTSQMSNTAENDQQLTIELLCKTLSIQYGNYYSIR